MDDSYYQTRREKTEFRKGKHKLVNASCSENRMQSSTLSIIPTALLCLEIGTTNLPSVST